MQVVSAAMIITNAGRRTAGVTALRITDTAALEQDSTRAVARPRPSALTVELLTPSSGHRPSSCTRPGLFFHRPLIVMSRYEVLIGRSPARRVLHGGRRNIAGPGARP